jgi:hypothetical protein
MYVTITDCPVVYIWFFQHFSCVNSFPKRDPKRIKEWVGQMKWKDWQPTPHSLLCSEHFEERCMDRTGQTVRLRDDAIPTIFAFPSHLQKKVFSIPI